MERDLNLPTKKAIGDYYEKHARQYLEAKGFKFIDQNVRYQGGELDLIMKNKECFVFIEVKYRKSNRFGGAISSISSQKKRRLLQTAYNWLRDHKLSATHSQYRFDAVIFNGDASNIHWIQNIITEG